MYLSCAHLENRGYSKKTVKEINRRMIFNIGYRLLNDSNKLHFLLFSNWFKKFI